MNLKLVIGVGLVIFAVSQVEGRCIGEKFKAWWERTKNVFKSKDQKVMFNETGKGYFPSKGFLSNIFLFEDPDCIKKAFKNFFRGRSMENADAADMEAIPKDVLRDLMDDGNYHCFLRCFCSHSATFKIATKKLFSPQSSQARP